MIDVDALTTTELRELADTTARALEQRGRLEAARTAVEDAVKEYAATAGCPVDEAWAALCPLDLAEPPTAPEPGPDDAPEWVQPVGAHDAYKAGATVAYDGALYEAITDANVWSPKAYPQGWRKL